MEGNSTTLIDVARLAGVSVSTVSRILRARSGERVPFAAKTQEKVRAAAAKTGYRPSKLARGLVGSKTGIVGLVVPSLEDSFFPSVTTAVQSGLNESGWNVLLASTEQSPEIERASIDEFLSWRVDGLIVAPSQDTLDGELFWDLRRMKVPFVLLDRYFTDTPFYSVTTDDYAGACMVVEHLLSCGKRRIARAGSPFPISTARLRHRGYIETLLRNGINPDPSYFIDVEPTCVASGRDVLRRLLELDPRPDALFCFSDMVAVGVIEECLARGIRIPDDLALVGYADLDVCGFAKVGLTSVRQPRRQIGRTAAELLVNLINGKPIDNPRLVLPVELVIRESSAGVQPGPGNPSA